MSWLSFQRRLRFGLTRVTRTVSLAQRVQVPFLAAAIAYYSFLSVVPLLVVGFAVATAVADETVATQVLIRSLVIIFVTG
jgi:uncharacterized BrkB/YihY/UPF0761 family membrane protein